VNLAQICSAVPEIFYTCTYKKCQRQNRTVRSSVLAVKSRNRKQKQYSKAKVLYPSYVCAFMALSLTIEEVDETFLCKSVIIDRDKFKESAVR